MSITLSLFSVGQSAYVAQFNNNFQAIQTAINNIESQIGVQGGGGDDSNMQEIWKRDGLIGASSFIVTIQSNTDLRFTSGSIWTIATLNLTRQTSEQQISFIGKSSGVYNIIIDTAGIITISTISSLTTIYKVQWNNPGFGSVERLVDILFDGEDYARMLSSVVFGSSTRVSDRLSSIEGSITIDTYYAQRIISGLSWEFKAGKVRNNNVIFSAASGSIMLQSNATHYIEIDPNTGVVSYAMNTGFTSGNIPIRLISTAGGAIVSNVDMRTWAIAGAGGGGGAITISGTPEATWQVNTDVASVAPTEDAKFEVRRGISANVSLRWNETTDRWQFTNDGLTFFDMENLTNFNLGGQRQSRLVMVASAPTILNESNRNSTSAPPYETLTLSAYISTTAFAVIIRGLMVDSNASGLGGPLPGIRFYRDSSTIVGDGAAKVFAEYASHQRATMIIVPVSDQKLVYEVEASSNNTATILFNLIGYFDTVQGVGTQRVCGTNVGMVVSSGVGKNFNISSNFNALMNRGIIYQLTTSAANIGNGSTYDVELYNTSQFTSSGIIFQALNIDASAIYTTRLPFMYEDIDNSTTIHCRISNHASTSGIFSLLIVAERFA